MHTRNIHGHIAGWLLSRFQQQPDFFQRTCTEFNDVCVFTHALGDVRRVGLQQRQLDARGVVLGQCTDAVE